MSDNGKDLALARDHRALLDLERRDPRRAEELWSRLSPEERLRVILAADGPGRERLITLAPDGPDLVPAMAPDDLARTLLELGPEDAGTLLGLSTDDQLSYLLDLTGWQRERFAPSRYQIWLPMLLDAGPHRLVAWLRSADLEVLALLFASWFQVTKFMTSQDEQEPPDDLPSFTLDGVYHLSFRDPDQTDFVAQVLVLLKSEQSERYEEVMEAMLVEPASQLAEDALRWRQGRLADHGFPPRLEALELWGRESPGETKWEKMAPKLPLGVGPRSGRVLSLLPDQESLPAAAAALPPELAEVVRVELAYVANCGVVGLEADPADPQAVARAATESLGLANLGLGLLSGGDGATAASILTRVSVAALARKGAAAIRVLNHRAWQLLDQGWLKGLPAGLHVLDKPLDRWLAGLVFPRPRCYDPGLDQGREYRAFTSPGDLEAAGRALDQAEFWGRLLFDLLAVERQELVLLWDQPLSPDDPWDLKTSTIVGTWLARRALGLPGLAPIPAASLGPAVKALQKGLKGSLAQEVMESCQALGGSQEAALASELLRGVLSHLEATLARLDPQAHLEPALVEGLVIK